MTQTIVPRVAGKKAFITGAAGGLGRAISHRLAEHGARLFLTDLNEAAVQAFAQEINARHGADTALAAAQDVSDEARWPDLLAEATTALGGLSVLVNNAGIGAMGGVESLTDADWRRVMAVDLDSIFYACKHALPLLRVHAPGSIINISSLAAFKIDPAFTVYNTAKAAVAALTKSVALDCARQKIDVRCNSVHPVFIRTGIVEPFFQKLGDEEAVRKLSRGIPMGRLGEPDDVAYAVLYLASDESRFITASELRIDGGASAA